LRLRSGDTLGVGEAAGEEEIKNGYPFVGGAGSWLRSLCKSAGLDFERLSLVNVIGCHPPGNVFPTDSKWHATARADGQRGVEYCAEHHLWPAIRKANKKRLIALGGSALKAITSREGITVWRGSPLPLRGEESRGPRVIPTIHPAALMRQAKLSSAVVSDLRKTLTIPPEHYNLFPTIDEVQAFDSTVFAFDFEWDSYGNVTLCGLTDRMYHCIVVPFVGAYVKELKRIFESAKALIGHNIIGADIAYIEQWGWDISGAEIHDTMLKQHLVQPDFPHNLGFVNSIFTNKPFWKGRGVEEED
jgi:uracil-DNA glycosylase family 4